MMTDGNESFGSEHTVAYIKVEIYCCTRGACNAIDERYLNTK